MIGWWIGEDVPEVRIERHQSTPLGTTDRCDTFVRGSDQALAGDGLDVVPGRAQEDRRLDRQVLVDLELQPPVPVRRSTKRSFASSAAYARHARMSSSVNDG